ncbi:TIGR03915 family putative DNA repair protein [Paraflavisolibacter sp. H34]|uniref:TIGR03915 family putative DNA repair protein n=1 Tax=Huijunlia imazamoxiresistens TaxID=3127457 RepID=UPI003019D823
MQTVLYDGSFEGWLCAVFDVYDYKFDEVTICTPQNFRGNIFEKVHTVHFSEEHRDRVWKGLQKKLSADALQALYRAFLSEEAGIETTLLQYVQYAFRSAVSMESDFSHPAVLALTGAAKLVWKEKHRMEAFVRFQKTGDGLYYALIEPNCNVLPLIAPHFAARYADQHWLIYDGKRRYGLHYDGQEVQQVEVAFSETSGNGKYPAPLYDETEELYQQLWRQYFKSVNIAARKNTSLQLRHMPRHYWKYLTEKNGNR